MLVHCWCGTLARSLFYDLVQHDKCTFVTENNNLFVTFIWMERKMDWLSRKTTFAVLSLVFRLNRFKKNESIEY